MSKGRQFAFFIAVQYRSRPKTSLAATLRLELSKKRKCEVCVDNKVDEPCRVRTATLYVLSDVTYKLGADVLTMPPNNSVGAVLGSAVAMKK